MKISGRNVISVPSCNNFHFSYLTHCLLIVKSITAQPSTPASHHQPNPSHLFPRNSSTSSLWSGHLAQTSQPPLSLWGSLITSANIAALTSSTPLLMPPSSTCLSASPTTATACPHSMLPLQPGRTSHHPPAKPVLAAALLAPWGPTFAMKTLKFVFCSVSGPWW